LKKGAKKRGKEEDSMEIKEKRTQDHLSVREKRLKLKLAGRAGIESHHLYQRLKLGRFKEPREQAQFCGGKEETNTFAEKRKKDYIL